MTSTLLTALLLIITSAGQDRLCGYLKDDPKKETLCVPDKVGVPYNSVDRDASVVVTSGMSCTFSARGVSCHGDRVDSDLLKIPEMKNVFALALPPYMGKFDACALTRNESEDSKAVCWGARRALEKIPVDLKSPSAIATNGIDACSLSDDGYVKCWGETAFGNSPYGVRGLRKLVMSRKQVCVVDLYGLMCWSHAGAAPVEVPRDLAVDGAVIDVAVIDSQICALTFEHQLQCFGEAPYDVPALSFPFALSSFGETICATDFEGLKCWGKKFEIPRPEKEDRIRTPSRIPQRPGQQIDPF